MSIYEYLDDIPEEELFYVDTHDVDISSQFTRFINKIMTAAIPISFGIGLSLIIVDGIANKIKEGR